MDELVPEAFGDVIVEDAGAGAPGAPTPTETPGGSVDADVVSVVPATDAEAVTAPEGCVDTDTVAGPVVEPVAEPVTAVEAPVPDADT